MCKYMSAKARHEIAKSMPEPTWYVDGLISEGFTLVAAKFKMKKSWFCSQMATAIASGKPFLGLATKQAEVLYLDLEPNIKVSDNRLMKQLGDDPIPDGLYIEKDGSQWTMGDGKFEEQLRYIIRETNIKVIIIDILPHIIPKKKKGETEYELATNVGKLIKGIIDYTDIAVIGVMHCNKTPFSEEDPVAQVLGSVGWEGASDNAVVWAKKRRYDAEAYLYTAGRSCPDVNAAVITFNEDTCRWEMIGSARDLERNRRAEEYEKKPAVKLIRTLLADKTVWQGTAQEAVEAASVKYSPESVGRYLNIGMCQEIQNRDGVTILKRRGRRGTEYYMTKEATDQVLTLLRQDGYEVIA